MESLKRMTQIAAVSASRTRIYGILALVVTFLCVIIALHGLFYYISIFNSNTLIKLL